MIGVFKIKRSKSKTCRRYSNKIQGRKEEMGLCRASADRLDILSRLWTNARIKPPLGASSAKTSQGGSNACAPTGPGVRSHLHGCRLAGPPEGGPTSRHPGGSSRLSRDSSLQGGVQEGLEWSAPAKILEEGAKGEHTHDESGTHRGVLACSD